MREINHIHPKGIITSGKENLLPSLSAALLIFLVAANWFTISFVGREHYLYFWDFNTYWEKVANITDHFPKDPYGTIRELYYSVNIRGDDYNLFPAFLLLPATILFGSSRMAYILSIVNIFALAAVASFTLLHMRLSKVAGYSSSLLPLVSVGLMLVSANFWSPILYGYLDVGGLVILNVILFLYLKSMGSRDKRLCSLSIAVLLPIAILFRRWYAYWVVGFYVASFVEQSCFLFLKSTFRLKDYGKVLLWIAVQVAVSGVFLMAVAPIFVTKSMTTSYADVFSVYRYSHSVIEAFTRVVDQFGLLAFLLFTAGLIQGVLNKETRQFSIFVLIQWLVVFFLFSRTQDFGFGPHHTYLLLSAMLLFSAMFVTRLVTKGSILATSSVAVLLILNCLAAFSSAELWHKKPLTYLLTGIRHLPLVRTDLSEIDRMLKVLSNTLTDTNDRVYVLASSDVLNSSILSSAYLTFHRYAELSKRIFWTHSMDKFEGFPQELLTARYVIVTDPIQYHLRPGDQRVVGIPAELIVTGKNIGTSFVKLPYEFFLDGGVKCYLYKKIKEFDRSDLTMLSQMFRNYYPDRPNIYHIGGI